jgi:uncharacterized damage-inducible protein DinB
MSPSDARLLAAYLYWLRDQIIRAAETLGPEAFAGSARANGRDLRETLVHELDIEMGWRARLRGEPSTIWEAGLEPADYPRLAPLAAQWRTDEIEMRAWIDGLTDADLARSVTVNGLEGYPLAVYLLHLLEHGIQEFDSAAAILSELGASPGDLGLLDALDDLAGAPGLPAVPVRPSSGSSA